MNIAIDARILTASFRGGILVYTERLIEHLARLDHENRYRLLFAGLHVKPESIHLRLSPNFHKEVLPFPDRLFPGSFALWNRAVLPAYFALRRIDVYHLPAYHHLTPSRLAARVITIHDLRSVHISDGDPQDVEAIIRSCRLADRIVAISDFTRQDIIRTCRIPESRISVVPLGVDEIYRPVEDTLAKEQLAARLGIDRPFFLSLGLVPRKNIPRLIEAFAGFRHRDAFQLVLCGHLGGDHVDRYRARLRELDLERCVVLPGALPTEDLVLLYNMARAFVFPSLLEGFGLPVLEAMACGAPVITSNRSALPEVVGEAALLVDPEDTASITQAMETLADDDARCQDLRTRGFHQVAGFSWDRMAQRLLAVYHSL